MNSRRTFLASVAAMVPLAGSKAFGGKWFTPKTSTIIFTNNTGVAQQMLISQTATLTSTFLVVQAGTSITATGTPGTATQLAVIDPTSGFENLAVTFPLIPKASATYSVIPDPVTPLAVVIK